jgi:hypothetical protein
MTQLFSSDLEHEIGREPLRVTPDLFIEAFRRNAVQVGQVTVQQHALPTQGENGLNDGLGGKRGSLLGVRCRHELFLNCPSVSKA